MHTSSLTYLVTLALALSAAASPLNIARAVNTVPENEPATAPDGVIRPAREVNARHYRGRKGFGGFGAGAAAAAAAGKGAAQPAKPATPAKATTAAAAASSAAAPPANNAAATKGGKGGNAGAAAPPATAAPPPAAAAGNGGGGDLQSSLTLSPTVIQTTDDGQNPPVTGQSGALLSKNNFANLCATTLPKVPITNGLQLTTGSCNPIPIGMIPSVENMPSSKFQSPANLDTIPATTAFNITLKTGGIELGTFTNAQKTYFANPQTLNAKGQIIGHTHVVIEAIDALTTTKLSNPQAFIFFKGVNDPADGQGNVVVPVAAGVKAGAYRMCTIVSSSTHQPAIVPVAQHGSVDDCVYVRCFLFFFAPVPSAGFYTYTFSFSFIVHCPAPIRPPHSAPSLILLQYSSVLRPSCFPLVPCSVPQLT
ncbi:hypothetical protein C8R47DRAFT_746964 [Mycena vitilis]|nr:hypothetical protein C8R47DRAFT_746964 [Mycena vitilis]